MRIVGFSVYCFQSCYANLNSQLSPLSFLGDAKFTRSWYPIVCEDPMSLKCINLRRSHELFLVICVISIAFVVAKLFYSSSEKGLTPFQI